MRKLDEKVKKLVRHAQEIKELEDAKPLPQQYDSLKAYYAALAAWRIQFENKKIELSEQ